MSKSIQTKHYNVQLCFQTWKWIKNFSFSKFFSLVFSVTKQSEKRNKKWKLKKKKKQKTKRQSDLPGELVDGERRRVCERSVWQHGVGWSPRRRWCQWDELETWFGEINGEIGVWGERGERRLVVASASVLARGVAVAASTSTLVLRGREGLWGEGSSEGKGSAADVWVCERKEERSGKWEMGK